MQTYLLIGPCIAARSTIKGFVGHAMLLALLMHFQQPMLYKKMDFILNYHISK